MVEETTTEQLAEIEGQAENTPGTGYTPPEGWRVVRFGELLLPGDVWVNWEGTESRPDILHGDGTTASGGRYIRRIKPEPQAEPEPCAPCDSRDTCDTPATGYTPPEGWRVLVVGEVLREGDMWVWPTDDQLRQTVHIGAVVGANQRYIRRIESEPQPQPKPKPNTAVIEELRSEVSYVQNLLGTERRRVTELEELVGSLRTINRGCENAVRDAGKENTALRNQLAAVKAELTSVAADRQQLRVELDAAQQVPADSPDLRQLRADLEQMTLGRDTYRDGYNRVLSDLETIRETAKAEAVEAIVEWLVPFRTCGSQALATAVISNLPHIMRSLTGLEDEDIE